MPIITPPEPLCYVVIDLTNGRELGGGKDWKQSRFPRDLTPILERWQRLCPGVELEVRQVSYTAYQAAFGLPDDWQNEWQELYRLGCRYIPAAA